MSNDDLELRELYKSEAEQYLFDGLQFDGRLKERVMSGIQSESKPTSSGKGSHSRRKRWIYSVMAAVAAVIILIAAPQEIAPEEDPPFNTFLDTENPGLVDDTNIGTTMMTSTPQSIEEAQSQFGVELRLPAYVPQSFELQKEIAAYGTVEGILDKVTFSYSTGTQTFLYTVDKNASVEVFSEYEKLELNGVTAYIDSLTETYTALYWVMDNRLYSIYGDLSREEALNVAKSVKTIN
ncbi:DUF4367 domain-containing protein [Paenibacillus prosopidis]|uniref:Uncharacterized protein DUF4367 n=1 Tax=Paenibacillus prosopidis TaxID=630520 RepID=A0A368VN63_9BACL|nr:DUF4367 domain-containing protein [Paenibacillus prosopidis]RCW42302.1 uncharacterized protein DUF4367 [Paenibacillus prosopidis]